MPESWESEALEYSEGAVEQLREGGFRAGVGAVENLGDGGALQGAFDAVCLFQTVEHMDAPHEKIAAIRTLLAPGGHVFISVPNGPSMETQERLAGLPDTPPNHVGRWTPEALTRLLAAHGIRVVECDLGPESGGAEIARLAHYAMLVDRSTGRKSPASLMARHASGRLRSFAELWMLRRHSKRIGRACPDPPPADIWIHATAAS